MNYLSVCSGIEAATVGWHLLGWQAVAFSEIEPFPCAALAHHYPNVPNWGDMTKFKEWPDAVVDVLVGGTPCQSFSVAGLRKGLDDPRGNLMLTYLAIAAKYRPSWLVWENVPGVLSSNGGRDFASLLRGMAELGYGFAYRILDAQHFGVPQRRRRVFVVGHLGDWQRAAAVLFERHSLQGHPAPRREAGKGFTHPVAPSLTSSGRGVERGGDTRGQDPVVAVHAPEIDRCIATREGTSQDWETATMVATPYSMMPMNSGKDFKARVTDVAQPVMAAGQTHGNQGGDVIVTHSLRGEGFDASEDGTGRGTPLVPVAYSMITANTGANGLGVAAEVAPTLDRAQPCAVAAFKGGQGSGAGSIGYSEHLAPTLPSADGGNRTPTLMQAMQVRRLTPVECSRLQGFPDDYLELAYANADEAHAAQVLHELWREARTPVIEKQGWRTGIVAALLTPEILFSGVHGGWLSWEMATRCAAARGALSGEEHNHEGFVRALRQAGTAGRSPFGRESFEQFARELGSDLSILPLESASARKVLRSSELWSQAQARWPLRYAFAKGKTGKAALMTPDGPRYKALGNSMAVPVMAWIGKRIQQVESI